MAFLTAPNPRKARNWAIIDEMSMKYLGQPYPRDQERMVALADIEWHKIGLD